MKAKFIVLTSVLALSIASIAYFSSKTTSFRIVNASDLAANPNDFQEENLRVRGHVKPGSLSRMGNKADFLLELDGKVVKVHYDGSNVLPDAFKEGVRVRVDGTFKNDVLVSNHVEAKCASKYEAGYAKEE
ncbi:MAG: cytochrome c maturation protein CcmE [Leptospiraceae bacterium]|nr:cytochrome c maturation protein CcmE [Leptospiraceae bacterium]MCP5497063.1 cytochrome c maturation protein CcmE [Leptospiraceae bacterium]